MAHYGKFENVKNYIAIVGNKNDQEKAGYYGEKIVLKCPELGLNPYELSGGEKQRVAICRALINNPDLILADESTGNFDSKSGKIVIDALNKISAEYKKTIVMVTHDPQMATFTLIRTSITVLTFINRFFTYIAGFAFCMADTFHL